MPKISCLRGLEILDSRGRPTVMAVCELEGGAVGSASVPSGASTGAAEALELRDRDANRYGGLGCRKAAANVSGILNNSISERSFETQEDFDRAMIELDGTDNKSRLGANAILAASLAFARAAAIERRTPLYEHFAGLLGRAPDALPRPTINLFPDAEALLGDAVEAIKLAGCEPGRDVALALDVAASHFYKKGSYHLGDEPLNGGAMIEYVSAWLDRYPIVSVEDGLSENDWESWPRLRERVSGRALTLGDDLLCTNPSRIRRAVESGAADALLLKVNQVGTLSEAAEALEVARDADWTVTVSARSGETEDNWLADLAVGWGGNQIKIGSITQSERLAKYNRLLEIEVETGLPLAGWPGELPR